MIKFFILCGEGLEDFAIDEIKKIGKIENIEKFPGVALFDFSGDYKKLINLKTVDDILVLVKKFQDISRYEDSLFIIKKDLSKANLMKTLFICRKVRKTNPETGFWIQSSYTGRRDYTAKEITASARRGILKNNNWTYDEKGDLHFHIILNPEISLCGVSLDKEPSHVKNRIKTIRGSLKSSIANALLKIGDVKKKDLILDPMCGSGIIPIAASLIGARATAGDIDKNAVEIAEENSRIKKTKIDFHVWDAEKTGLEDKMFDKIICNVPFDKQVESSYNKEKFVEEVLRVSKKKSKLIFLMDPENKLKRILKKKFPEMKSIKIKNSGLTARIVIIDRL
jgi:tRNA (guanine6-N2)-methyltransferase